MQNTTTTPDSMVRMPYPENPAQIFAYRSPLLLFRMGLGKLIGQLFMVLTTFGRKSGEPRRAVIEYHTWKGRKYVFSAWGEKSQWYRNILANPNVTIQTVQGTEHVRARRLTTTAELNDAFDMIENTEVLRKFIETMTTVAIDRELFLRDRERFYVLTFEPTAAACPPPQEADLAWVPPLLLGLLTLLVLIGLLKKR